MHVRHHCLTFAFILTLASSGAIASPPGTDLYGDPLPNGAAARFGTVRFRRDWFHDVADIAPDGKHVAYTDSSGSLRVVEVPSGRTLYRFNRPSVILYPAFSPTGRLLAAWAKGQGIRVWDMATGREKVTLSKAPAPDGKLGISANDRFLLYNYTPDGYEHVTVWEIDNATRVGDFRCPGDGSIINSLSGAMSPDGGMVACWASWEPVSSSRQPDSEEQGVVLLWNVATKKQVLRIHARERIVGSAAWSPDSRLVAIASGRGTLQLFDSHTGKQVGADLQGSFSGRPLATMFSPDGRVVAIAGNAANVALWDVESHERMPVPIPDRPGCRFVGIALAAEKPVCCGATDRALQLWELESGIDLRLPAGHSGPIESLAFTGKKNGLASTAEFDEVYRWSLSNFEHVPAYQRPAPLHDEFLRNFIANASTVSPDGAFRVEPDRSLTRLRVRSLENGAGSREIPIFPPARTSFTPDSKTAVSFASTESFLGDGHRPARHGEEAIVWEPASGHVRARWAVETACIRAPAFSPDQPLVAALMVPTGPKPAAVRVPDIGMNEDLVLWDARSGKKLWKAAVKSEGGFEDSPPLVFGPDKLLAAPDSNMNETLWDVTRGKPSRPLVDDPGWLCKAALFSSDGRTLVVGITNREDKTKNSVRLLEVATGATRAEFTGHDGPITALAFSADHRMLASGSEDTTILLWDLAGDGRQPRERPLAADLAEKLWTDLDSRNAGLAYRAVLRLANSPREAVALLKSKLPPARPANLSDQDLARLIQDLDASQYAAREKAASRLRLAGTSTLPALRLALADKPSPELTRRLKTLIADLESPLPLRETLRDVRAVEVLEQIATADARHLLQTLATGDPQARLTQEAKRSLAHLALHSSAKTP